YTPMPNPAALTEEFKNIVGQKKVNDEVDNIQLFQVQKGYVDYFITEDKGIKEKAKKINLTGKVLSIEDGLTLLKKLHYLVIPQHPLLEECSVREVESEIDQPFFDSLREGYMAFNDWFLKCSRENRKCYLLRVENKITALLIYHREKPSSHGLPNISADVIKMCTLKVDETVFGYRLGELFLNKMFELCIRSSVKYLYLTVFPHHVHLINLLSKYGFIRDEFTNKEGKTENRIIKSFIKPLKINETNSIISHPFYTDNGVNKFVIPINPKFYYTLFKDGSFRSKTLFDATESSLSEIEGNTISKAYLCKSKSLSMKKGDLLLFYGSKSIGSIEPIGVLDEVIYTKDINLICEKVKRKTVYSDTDLSEMANGKKDVTVLIFRLLYYLEKPIKQKEIKLLESYNNKFQTITLLKETDYNSLKQKKHFDERYIIN
ncbi:MAG: hypothetical protein H0X63_07780, partial [Flavobacteriales bacterium]|nr:hypothetical protein [Flavobacteriales bacterium]